MMSYRGFLIGFALASFLEDVIGDYSGIAEGLSRAQETSSFANDDNIKDNDNGGGRRVNDEVTDEHDGDHRGRTSGR